MTPAAENAARAAEDAIASRDKAKCLQATPLLNNTLYFDGFLFGSLTGQETDYLGALVDTCVAISSGTDSYTVYAELQAKREGWTQYILPEVAATLGAVAAPITQPVRDIGAALAAIPAFAKNLVEGAADIAKGTGSGLAKIMEKLPLFAAVFGGAVIVIWALAAARKK